MAKALTANFKVISDHAEATADGAVHAPLSVFTLSEEQRDDPFNQERIKHGVFVETLSEPTGEDMVEKKTTTNDGGSD